LQLFYCIRCISSVCWLLVVLVVSWSRPFIFIICSGLLGVDVISSRVSPALSDESCGPNNIEPQIDPARANSNHYFELLKKNGSFTTSIRLREQCKYHHRLNNCCYSCWHYLNNYFDLSDLKGHIVLSLVALPFVKI
jgi:hypothetical protein